MTEGEGYTPTIGLEIHAELKTATKMFCACANVGEDEYTVPAPNAYICPVCMGHPGTLPFVNKKAVESVITVGLALGSDIATYTEFDRKNYFYPDIPKGYQISQYLYPLVKNGMLNGVAITRVHLEEDTARSLHDQGEGSLVDYNRAGVPLMELVTEPVIHDAKTAGDFARELQLLLRALGVSDAHMERGHMRVEANISISKDATLGTKVEVKNLNSFRSVEAAIEFEIKRHREALERGETLVQETRGWDEVKQKTFAQRKKESSHDYRYFPDPDIPKIDFSVSSSIDISRLSENMPELPSNKRKKYSNLGIPSNQIEILVSNSEVGAFLERALDGAVRDSVSGTTSPETPILVAPAKPVPLDAGRVALMANYLTSDVLGLLLQDSARELGSANGAGFVELVDLLLAKEINSRVAKDLLPEVIFGGKKPATLIAERSLGQLGESALAEVVETVVAEHPGVVLEYKTGKHSVLQFLVGQGMRLTKGASNPETLGELLRRRLD